MTTPSSSVVGLPPNWPDFWIVTAAIPSDCHKEHHHRLRRTRKLTLLPTHFIGIYDSFSKAMIVAYEQAREQHFWKLIPTPSKRDGWFFWKDSEKARGHLNIRRATESDINKEPKHDLTY